MQGVKSRYSVDALKVCFSIKPEVYNNLTEIKFSQSVFVFSSPNYCDDLTEDFRLRRVKDSKFEFDILVPSEKVDSSHTLFGTLIIKSNEDLKFAGKCFISLNNRTLYEPFDTYAEVLDWKPSEKTVDISSLKCISDYTKIKHEIREPSKVIKIQYNTIFFLLEISNRLQLDVVSISNLEIAFDSNINFARLIKRTVADLNFIPVVNRIKYLELNSREEINNAFLNYSTTRQRAVNLSYYVQQSKGRLELKCYNKSKEINGKSHKTYIYRWLGMDKNVHRMEIKAKREPINSYCKENGLQLSEFLGNLYTGENLSDAFNVWLNRLIHFKKASKPNGRDISVFDLVSLNKKY